MLFLFSCRRRQYARRQTSNTHTILNAFQAMILVFQVKYGGRACLLCGLVDILQFQFANKFAHNLHCFLFQRFSRTLSLCLSFSLYIHVLFVSLRISRMWMVYSTNVQIKMYFMVCVYFFLLFLPLLGDCVASKLIEYNLFSHLLSFLRTQIVDAAAVFFCSLFIKVNTHHRNHYPFIYQAFSAWNNFLLYFTSLHSGSRRRRSKKGNALHYRREKKQICSYHFHMKRILNTIDTLRFIFLLFINLLSCTSPPLSLHTAARKIIHG